MHPVAEGHFDIKLWMNARLISIKELNTTGSRATLQSQAGGDVTVWNDWLTQRPD